MRNVAYRALKEWKAGPGEAVLFEPPYATTYLSPRTVPLILVGVAVVLLLLIIARWVRRFRAIGGFAVVSGLLLAATALLWVRSHWRIDDLSVATSGQARLEIAVIDGTIRFMQMESAEPTPASFVSVKRDAATEKDWNPTAWPQFRIVPVPSAEIAGFKAQSGGIRSAGFGVQKYQAYTAPLWALCVVFAMLPMLRLGMWIRRRRRPGENCCQNCGYDLRATPQRCPECGTRAATSQPISQTSALPLIIVGLALSMLSVPAAALSVMLRNPDKTVEWRVARSALIVRGIVSSQFRSSVLEQNDFATVTVRVAEVIKGPAKANENIVFICRNINAYPWFDAGRSGKEYLFCLMNSQEFIAGEKHSPAETAFVQTAPWWLPQGTQNEPIPLFEKPLTRIIAYDAAPAKSLEDFDAIMKAFRHEAAVAPTAYGLDLVLWSSSGPPGEFSEPDLLIPIDQRALQHAKVWAKSTQPIERYNACNALAHFESAESIALLRGMLDDPFLPSMPYWPDTGGSSFYSGGEGKWSSQAFRLREDAFAILKKWDAAPKEAMVSQFAYVPMPLWRWGRIAAAALIVIVLLLPFIFHRRTTRFRPRVFTGMCGVCLLLLMTALAFWAGSAFWIFDLSTPAGGNHRLELACITGRLRVIWFEDWKDPSPALLNRVRLTSQTLKDWGEEETNPSLNVRTEGFNGALDAKRFAGFAYLTSGIEFRGMNSSRCKVVYIPFWAICLPLAILPVRRIRAQLRYRQRVRDCRCLTCGYDLRATPDRCPECGLVKESPQRTEAADCAN